MPFSVSVETTYLLLSKSYLAILLFFHLFFFFLDFNHSTKSSTFYSKTQFKPKPRIVRAPTPKVNNNLNCRTCPDCHSTFHFRDFTFHRQNRHQECAKFRTRPPAHSSSSLSSSTSSYYGKNDQESSSQDRHESRVSKCPDCLSNFNLRDYNYHRQNRYQECPKFKSSSSSSSSLMTMKKDQYQEQHHQHRPRYVKSKTPTCSLTCFSHVLFSSCFFFL